MTPDQFKQAADTVAGRWPDARLDINARTNAIEVRTDTGSYGTGRPVAYIEGYDGEVIEL